MTICQAVKIPQHHQQHTVLLTKIPPPNETIDTLEQKKKVHPKALFNIKFYEHLQANCNKWENSHIVCNTDDKNQPQSKGEIFDI